MSSTYGLDGYVEQLGDLRLLGFCDIALTPAYKVFKKHNVECFL
jgi:hypothetical protein